MGTIKNLEVRTMKKKAKKIKKISKKDLKKIKGGIGAPLTGWEVRFPIAGGSSRK